MDSLAISGVVVLVFIVLFQFAVHKIEEGHVGVYYRVSIINRLFLFLIFN